MAASVLLELQESRESALLDTLSEREIVTMAAIAWRPFREVESQFHPIAR